MHFNATRYALATLPVELPPQPLPAGILTLKNRTLSPVVDRFLEAARAVAGSFAEGGAFSSVKIRGS